MIYFTYEYLYEYSKADLSANTVWVIEDQYSLVALNIKPFT